MINEDLVREEDELTAALEGLNLAAENVRIPIYLETSVAIH